MRSEGPISGNLKKAGIFVFIVFQFLFLISNFSSASAELFDRVVAFVDDKAITLSEFQEHYRNMLKVTPDVTEEDVLDTMINRILLLREAEKYRIEAPTKEEVMKEYIDLKVRAYIRVAETEIEGFYRENLGQFEGKEYEAVRDEIERYLTEKELNERLRETIRGLRQNAYIKVQLREG